MKIFVSSTFEDLIDHRSSVDQILNRLGAQFHGMEYFGARPFEPKLACFQEIQQADIFVGIYAHRYGWIPEGDTLSITEQEFDEARRCGIPCYCYVVEPSHPWNPKHIELPALEQLKRFQAKVGTLVRSRFTTPDNLAKQIAADLVAAFTGRNPSRTPIALLEHLRTCVSHEIATTIGTKYIRDLYVGRNLDRALQLRLDQPKRISMQIAQVVSASEKLQHACRELTGKLMPASVELPALDGALANSNALLRELTPLSVDDPRLNYPAHELVKALEYLRNTLAALQHIHDVSLGHHQNAVHELRLLGSALQTTHTSVAELESALKPVHLIVDRAGGGKTNLLCHLAESLSTTMPTLFAAGRSLAGSTEDALLDYFKSVYPVGADPIAEGAKAAASFDRFCVVIVDGINEHHDPRSFNASLKSFLRRYYNLPVRFIISCRDIYWRYFEDDWWLSHGAEVSRNALYAFTSLEFQKALPLYLSAFDVDATPKAAAEMQLRHPLLLRFFCEAYRGSPASPTRLGVVNELRLLELFDAYCNRKFDQIRARLGLIDADEIFQYIKMIALDMLDARSRLLSVEQVASRAQHNFGERSIRTADSRYVQILDEDILIEERPAGDLGHAVVSFVYDEFMEYIIARALWSDSVSASPGLAEVGLVQAIVERTTWLRSIGSQFVSVAGVILYLTEMIARISPEDLEEYLLALHNSGDSGLVCELATRIGSIGKQQVVFKIIVEIFNNGSKKGRHDAWIAIDKIAHDHFAELIDMITDGHATSPPIAPERALPLIRRASESLTPLSQMAALRLVHAISLGKVPRVRIERGVDFGAALNTARALQSRNQERWSQEEQVVADELVKEILNTQRK